MQAPQELLESKKKGWWRSIGQYFLMGAVVIVLAIYVGLLLFGPNSLEVLYQLRAQKRQLERNVKFLKHENARLQKEYFELKELEVQE